MELKDNIYKLRKAKKISQEDLAEKIGVTRQTISNWELGSTTPNPKQLILLSKTLFVSVDELLGNDIKENNSIIDNHIKSKEFMIFILFVYIIISIIWGIVSIVYLLENEIPTSLYYLILCIIWCVISVMWYFRKVKK